ncbi:MAG TPA: DUF1573 domain-containing protein [Blastocatellia bacterium]|jgi:hypothetical protein|nr:DUF1573 domain-containing protein [Blastocatellia bacterium]
MKARLASATILVLMLFAFSAVAQNPTPQSGSPKLATDSFEHAFGAVKPGTPLTYTFKIRNEGEGDLQIKSVNPACGCTASSFDKVIPPGKSGAITLSIEKTETYKGDIVKTATVTTNDPAKASFILTLRATFVTE